MDQEGIGEFGFEVTRDMISWFHNISQQTVNDIDRRIAFGNDDLFQKIRPWWLQGLSGQKENMQNEQITSNQKSSLKAKRRRSHSTESDIEGNSNESSNVLENRKRRRVSDMEEK
ncbi:MAG: hypothetical protein EZS28_022948 [Streblomastix strix]|uniref:Uncharacterized protein n=1 Tax=Streblomastix strix TaxID=222440 RepID=A0A5J4VGG5_9EUKA|nr:MAG: hypothetical protein EZS28_022948 [Streblomastix strix]